MLALLRYLLQKSDDGLRLFQAHKAFQHSFTGPDNRRIIQWMDRADRREIHGLLKHACRFCLVAMSVSWNDGHSNCCDIA